MGTDRPLLDTPNRLRTVFLINGTLDEPSLVTNGQLFKATELIAVLWPQIICIDMDHAYFGAHCPYNTVLIHEKNKTRE